MLPRSGMVTSITHSLYTIILLLTKPHTLMPSEFHYISPITSLGHQKPTMKSVVAYIVAYIISYDEYKWSCSPLRGLVESYLCSLQQKCYVLVVVSQVKMHNSRPLHWQVIGKSNYVEIRGSYTVLFVHVMTKIQNGHRKMDKTHVYVMRTKKVCQF